MKAKSVDDRVTYYLSPRIKSDLEKRVILAPSIYDYWNPLFFCGTHMSFVEIYCLLKFMFYYLFSLFKANMKLSDLQAHLMEIVSSLPL